MSERDASPNKKFNSLVTTWNRIFPARAGLTDVITTASERDVIILGDKYDNRVFDEYEIHQTRRVFSLSREKPTLFFLPRSC